jgi:hypothetical protein
MRRRTFAGEEEITTNPPIGRSVGHGIPARGTVQGLVTIGGNVPPSPAIVTIAGAGPSCRDIARFAETDAEGRFELTGLTPGEYDLLAHAADPREPSTKPPAGPFRVRVEPNRVTTSDLTIPP